MPLKIVGQGHWRGDVPKDGNKKNKKAYSFEGRKKKQSKVFFFTWKKDNDAKVKCIWSAEKTQGAAVKNKTFENMWRSFSDDEKNFAESSIKKACEW
jgi:hypothetical protein